VFLQLASGLQHLHSCGVLHRDLTTDNALVASMAPLVVKWADFDCCIRLDAAAGFGSLTETQRACLACRLRCLTPATWRLEATLLLLTCTVLPSLCAEKRLNSELQASIAWLAPETVADPSDTGSVHGPSTPASDVYMLGSTFLELATGCTRAPYDWLADAELLRFRCHPTSSGVGPVQAAVIAGRPFHWSVHPGDTPTGGMQLAALLETMHRCLAADPAARPTAAQLVDALGRVADGRAAAPALEVSRPPLVAVLLDDCDAGPPAGSPIASTAITAAAACFEAPTTPVTTAHADMDVVQVCGTVDGAALSPRFRNAVGCSARLRVPVRRVPSKRPSWALSRLLPSRLLR
jgi:serine/threonine protein kinase